MFESVCQCAEGLEWAAGCDTEQAKRGKWAGRNHFFPILRHFYAANCEQHWPVPPASGLCWCTWTTHCEPEPGAPNLEHKNTSHVWQLKREFWGQIKQQDKSQRCHAWETAAALRAPPSHFLFRGKPEASVQLPLVVRGGGRPYLKVSSKRQPHVRGHRCPGLGTEPDPRQRLLPTGKCSWGSTCNSNTCA